MRVAPASIGDSTGQGKKRLLADFTKKMVHRRTAWCGVEENKKEGGKEMEKEKDMTRKRERGVLL